MYIFLCFVKCILGFVNKGSMANLGIEPGTFLLCVQMCCLFVTIIFLFITSIINSFNHFLLFIKSPLPPPLFYIQYTVVVVFFSWWSSAYLRYLIILIYWFTWCNRTTERATEHGNKFYGHPDVLNTHSQKKHRQSFLNEWISPKPIFCP